MTEIKNITFMLHCVNFVSETFFLIDRRGELIII